MGFGRGKPEDRDYEIVEVGKKPTSRQQKETSGRREREQSTRSSRTLREESRRDRTASPRKTRQSISPRKNVRQSASPRRRSSVASPRNTARSPRSSATSPRNTVSSPKSATKSPRNIVGSPKAAQSKAVASPRASERSARASPVKSRAVSPGKKVNSSRPLDRHTRSAVVSSQPLLQQESELVVRSESTRRNGYQPPQVESLDSQDDIVSRIGQENEDKYTTLVTAEESVDPVSAKSKSRYSRPNDTFMTKHPKPGRPVVQPPGRTAASRNPVSEISSQSYEGTDVGTVYTKDEGTVYTKDEGTYYSDMNRTQPSKLSQREILSMSTIDSERFLSREEAIWSDDDYIVMKQRIAYLCIIVSAVQLGVLLIQLILCGVASVAVNPMIGPFPDSFSEFGGKNAYLMLEDHQYFRLVTPAFLNVGLIHLLINVFCQLETCAFFEREWGSLRWLLLYCISTVGCVATSSVFNPDDIAVCSSGAIMGLFGAKIAQVITWTAFDLRSHAYFDSAQLDQLGGVMCSAALVSLLSFVTYIEWSGHMGGFAAGFFAGMFMFCKPIASICSRLIWGFMGLAGLFGGALYLGHTLLNEVSPDEDLGDACQYFRNLYPEGYDCECAWK